MICTAREKNLFKAYLNDVHFYYLDKSDFFGHSPQRLKAIVEKLKV
jgi:hypothetical protein